MGLAHEPQPCVVTAIPCGLIGRPGGLIECVPISDEVPLSRTSHYVAGVPIPHQPSSGGPLSFEDFYAILGVATIPTVCDGDCGVDVMTMMLGLPQSFEARKQLRIELSDYLWDRMGERWLLDLLVAAQELDFEDVQLCCSDGSLSAVAALPMAPAPAVADPPAIAEEAVAPQEEHELEAVPDETLDAMRWASNLDRDANVLALIRSLPPQIIEEQVVLYRDREKPAVAAAHAQDKQLVLSRMHTYQQRMAVALRFHRYCEARGIHHDGKMPYGSMKTFIQDNIAWAAKLPPRSSQIHNWYTHWRSSPSNLAAAVAERPSATVCIKSLLKSRATKQLSLRKRAPGGCNSFHAPLVRQELYAWWSSIRYAIDWRQLVVENRSRGLRKNLARFPRSILVHQVNRLLQ